MSEAEVKVGDKVRLTGRSWKINYPDAPEVVTVERIVHGEIVGSDGVRDIGQDGALYAADSDKAPGYACELIPTVDPVNHPAHYISDPSGVECIQVTRHRNFNVGNAIKYLWRAGLKSDAAQGDQAKHVEDLRKAVWYIEDEIARISGAKEAAWRSLKMCM